MKTSNPTTPRHLGIILDGNRRWAKQSGLPKLEGHRKGYENLKTVCEAALDAGIEYVSAYVFSTENWNRSKTEVNYLMRLLKWVATEEVDEFLKKNIRVRFAGTKERLNKDIVRLIEAAEEKTKHCNRGELILCLNYGGHQELVDAAAKLVADGLKPEQVTEDELEKRLYVPDVPPVDLIIRTSGEQRLSNFMLWRAAYSELMFVETHWPDFSGQDLKDCLSEYAKRHRRFGS
jgi:undecaprenyl diphosphate synthase